MNNQTIKFEKNYIDLMKYFDYSSLFEILISKIDFTGKKVLDLGCGEGTNTIIISQHALEVVGLDQSEILIDSCNQKILSNSSSNIKFILGNAQKLPFENSYFDILLTFWSLHEFKNYDRSFNEIKRVLKKNGTIISIEPLQKSVWSHIEYIIEKIYQPNKFIFTDIFWIKYLSYLHRWGYKWKYYFIKPRYIFPNIFVAYDIIMKFFDFGYDSSKLREDIRYIISNLPKKDEKIYFYDESLLLIAKIRERINK
jgi:ubiquinone/menaquinone biosynthesis C-methylase UbiE